MTTYVEPNAHTREREFVEGGHIPKTWDELRHRARQMRPVRTNPTSYKHEELDIPSEAHNHD